MTTEELIRKECDELRDLLIMKNRRYGDTGVREGYPFKLDPRIAIKARLNDKIGRLANDPKDEDEDILQDIMGYIVLLRIAQKQRS